MSVNDIDVHSNYSIRKMCRYLTINHTVIGNRNWCIVSQQHFLVQHSLKEAKRSGLGSVRIKWGSKRPLIFEG